MRIGQGFDRFVVLDDPGAPHPVPTRSRTFPALDLSTLDEVVLALPEPRPAGRGEAEAEADEARRIEARELPRILLLGRVDEQPFLASEWVPGLDLTEVLRDGPLDPDSGLFVLGSMVAALAALHSRGLVHGNLHPGHVRVGTDGRVRVVGYFPAHYAAPESSRPPEAKVSRFAPPEWYASGVLSPAGDVYSTALVGYQIFSGRNLLPAANLRRNQDAQLLLQKSLDRIERVARSIPAALGPLFHSMLQLDRARRPRNGFLLLAGLVKAMPHWVPDGPPPPALLARIQAGALRARRRRLEGAARAAAEGWTLAAAARLRALTEVGGTPSPAEQSQAGSMLRTGLWESFVDGGPPEAREALLLQVARAAAAFDLPGTAFLARARLAQLARPGTRIHEVGFPEASRASLEAQRASFLAWAATRPADDEALLPLAILTPGLRVLAGTGVNAIRSALCRRLGLGGAALYHRALDLAKTPTDPALLAELQDLCSLATEPGAPASDPAASSPPPSEPGTILRSEVESWIGPRSSPGEDSEVISLLEEISRPPGTEERVEAGAGADEPEPLSILGARGASRAQAAAERALAAGQQKLAEGALEEAVREFSGLLKAEVGVRERFHAALCGEVRRLAWRLLPGAGAPAGTGLRSALLELARGLGMGTLAKVLERFLLDAIPEGERGIRLDELAARHPESIEIQRRAAAESARIGDDVLTYRHLVALGFLLADLGAVAEASRCFLAARALADEPRLAVAGMARVFEQGARIAEAAEQFRLLAPRLAASPHAEDGLAACEEFLGRYPGYPPCLERAIDLAIRAGDSRRAARFSTELANRALAEDRPQRARELLREVLRAEPDHDEAMLAIASIEPLAPDSPRDPLRLRIALLAREGLFPAAIHHARRLPSGGPDGGAVHDLLIDLARRADQDVSPYLLGKGFWAMGQGKAVLARATFEEAIEVSPQRNVTVDTLVRVPGIDAVFPRMELARLKT